MLSRLRYNEQKHNAEQRGIPFNFTFEEWKKWWFNALGEDWLRFRGRKRNQYCMARLNDQGDYSPDNVKCILHSENCSEMKINGRLPIGVKSYKAKLSEEDVKNIFITHKPLKEIQEIYNISIGTIIDIRSGRTWKHVTSRLTRSSILGRNQWH